MCWLTVNHIYHAIYTSLRPYNPLTIIAASCSDIFVLKIIFVLIFILFSKNNFRSYSILVLKIIFVFNFVLRQRLIASAYMLTIT